jgi:hypothetical protein
MNVSSQVLLFGRLCNLGCCCSRLRCTVLRSGTVTIAGLRAVVEGLRPSARPLGRLRAGSYTFLGRRFPAWQGAAAFLRIGWSDDARPLDRDRLPPASARRYKNLKEPNG